MAINNTFGFGASSSEPGEYLVARMQNRRGNRVNLPQPLAPGELGLCEDTKQLFIGTDYPISAVTLYETSLATRNTVNSILNNRVIQFSTKWAPLNQTASISSGQKVPESELISELSKMAASAFVDATARSAISDTENNISIIKKLNEVAHKAVSSPIQSTDFSSLMHTVYDWDMQDAQSAKGTITIAGGSYVSHTIDLINPGLGYCPGEEITVISGLGAHTTEMKFQPHTMEDDGQGMLIDLVPMSGFSGAGYADGTFNVTFSLPKRTLMTKAIAGPAILSGGQIQSVPLQYGGQQYMPGDLSKAPKVTIVDSTGFGAKITAIVDAAGYINMLHVDEPGENYTAPTIYIEEPRSHTFYRFRYLIGVSDPAWGATESATAMSYLNDVAEYGIADGLAISVNPALSMTTINSAPMPNGSKSIVSNSMAGDAKVAGVGGYGYNVNLASDLVALPTPPTHAASLSAIINAIAKPAYTQGIVTTKQNIEIATEYTIPPPPQDLFFLSLSGETLNTTPDLVTYGNTLLNFDRTLSNVVNVRYSLRGTSYVRHGNLNIVSLSTMASDNVISDTFSEVGTAPTGFAFRVTNLSGNIMVLQYTYTDTTTSTMSFKYIMTRWEA